MAALISLCRGTYLRHRTGVLVAAKLAGFLALGSFLQPHVALLPRVMALDGPPPATSLLRAALLAEQVRLGGMAALGGLCKAGGEGGPAAQARAPPPPPPASPRSPAPHRPQGLLLLVGALGWELPLRTHLWVQAVGLARLLSLLPAQCAAQAGVPGYGAMYSGLAGWLGSACGALFPVTVAARRDGLPPQPCLAVGAWALVVVGYALPALLLHYSQTRLRGRLLEESGAARGGLPGSEPWLAAAVHAGMALVALPVAWRAVEVGAPLWGALFAAGGAGGSG